MPPPYAAVSRRAVLALGLTAGLAAACGSPSDPGPAPWQARLRSGTDDRPREVAVLGDSIAFGGGQWGSSAPKWQHSFVGRLRTAVEPASGDAGTGWVFLNQALWPTTALNRGWDPRLAVVGDVAKVERGLFRRTCARVPAARSGRAPAAYVELTASGTSFSVLALADPTGRARPLVSVDGAEPLRLSGGQQDTRTPDVAPRTGLHPGHVVTDVPTPGAGPHTLRVWGDGGAVDLVALRASTGTGRLVVTSAAVSGESLGTFCGPGADDEQGGTTGLAFLDTLRADLLLVELGANDYNAGRPLAPVREELLAVVARQRAWGGDVALLFPPISSPTLYKGGDAPTYAAYAAMFGEVARDQSVPFLDLTHLWGATFEESSALRPARYADAIHPSDAGATDIAERCRAFLGL